jgi:acid phosphatase family membrane protein YuiD
MGPEGTVPEGTDVTLARAGMPDSHTAVVMAMSHRLLKFNGGSVDD